MDVRKISVFFAHIASNIGDLAINQGTLRLLRTAFPQATVHFVLLNARESRFLEQGRLSLMEDGETNLTFFKAAAENALPYLVDPAQLLSDCGAADSDLIVLASGEHLYSYAHGENADGLFWRILPALAAKVAGKSCYLLPSTLGPFMVPHGKDLARSFLHSIDGYAVRDAQSTRLVTDQLDIAAPITLLDPAFFLAKSENGWPAGTRQEASHKLGLAMRSEGWGIRLSAQYRRRATDAFKKDQYRSDRAYQFSYRVCTHFLQEEEHSVQIFVQTVADTALATSLRDRLRSDGYGERIEVIRPTSIEDYMSRLGDLRCLISSRFHALILAGISGTPVFGTYFDAHGHKIPGLFEHFQMKGSYVNLSAVKPQEGAEMAIQAIQDRLGQLLFPAKRVEELKQETVAWISDWSNKTLPSEPQFALTRSLTAQCATMYRDEKAVLEEQLANSKSKLEELKTRLKAVELRAEILQRKLNHAVERHALDLKRLRLSSKYQIGNELVEAARNPARLVRLPARLFRIYQTRWNSVMLDNGEIPRLGLEGEEFVLILEREGIDAVIGVIRSQFPENEMKAARQMLQVGGRLRDLGHDRAEYELTLKALELSPSEDALRAAVYAANRVGEVEVGAKLTLDFEKQFGSPSAKKSLASLKKQPAHLLNALRHLGPRQQLTYEPIANRIVYILHNSRPYSNGGYATRSHGVATGMKAAGFNVVATTRPGFPVDVSKTLKARALPLEDEIEGIQYHRILGIERSDGEYIRKAAEALEAHFRKLRPSLVVAASFAYTTALPALIAARRLGLPFIYDLRGLAEITLISAQPGDLNSAKYKVYHRLEAETAKAADFVFTLTDAMRQEMISRGVPEEQIELLPNSCNPDLFTPRSRDLELSQKLRLDDQIPVIGYIGTFVQYEGLDDLVSACTILKKRGHTFRLVLVGNENVSGTTRGPITKKIECIAQEGSLSNWLIMPGRVPHEAVARWYSLIDIAPFPRKSQPVTEMVSPMKPLEALAMEKAVVVSSVHALQEMVVRGETGLVFEKGSVESLADMLEKLILDVELRHSLGKAARQWVLSERTWSRMGEVFKKRAIQVMGRAGITPQ